MPTAEPYEPAGLTGDTPGGPAGEHGATLGAMWELGKLSDISDAQAREDLGRLSAR